MSTVLTLLYMVVIVLTTAWFIRDAIVAFKEQRYFAFGFNAMLILWEIALFVDAFIKA